MIKRHLESIVLKKIPSDKAIIILGPRQVGKTTLLEKISGTLKSESVWMNGDEYDIQELFRNSSATRLKSLFGKASTVIIDEAQRIPEIGLRLKLITDKIKNVQVIVSGSSAFELGNTINESLTGRKWEYKMLPLSFSEMTEHHGLIEERRLLPQRLVYGYYPEIVTHPGEEEERLRELAESYLYKDLFTLESVKKSSAIVRLLRAIAHQVGSQVSYSELSRAVGLDMKTVEKYIDILEKAFIIFRIGSYSNNLRNELSKSKKIYFYDNGIMNALLNDFTFAEARIDIGKLWENFFVAERFKLNTYNKSGALPYFWRTRQGQEIDLLEIRNRKIEAFEIKWGTNKKVKVTSTFTEAYPNASVHIVTPNNFDQYLAP